jgi:outer membrane protein assembly factor BamA
MQRLRRQPKISRRAALAACIPAAGLLIAAPLCGAVEQAQDPSVVDSVVCEGLVRVKEDAVRQVLSLKAGSDFSPQQMEADRKAVLGLGYFRTVTSTQRTVNGKTTVTLRLVEWPQVAHLRILGNTVIDRKALLDSLSLQVGQVFNASQLVDDIHAVEQLYRERGYVAHVSERILDEATRTGILRFEILEVKIGEITFDGGDEALRAKARRAVREVPPNLYRPEAVTVDQLRLLKIKGVNLAQARVETLDPARVRIRWMLNPAGAKSDSSAG